MGDRNLLDGRRISSRTAFWAITVEATHFYISSIGQDEQAVSSFLKDSVHIIHGERTVEDDDCSSFERLKVCVPPLHLHQVSAG